ncbi:MAG: restriction endonuclease subunit S, partial [Candidatus Paceibacterota bacterium]
EMFGDPVRNPKGWEVKKLGKILENKDSERVPVKKSDRKEMAGEYPYYGASGIVDYVDDYLFEGPNLLIGEDGANLLSRSTEIAFIADGKYWVNNHAHVLGSERINLLHYVKYFINNLDLEPYITGSAQPKLNQGNLNKIEVPLPDEQYIEEFERRLNKITTEKTATESLLEKSEEFFSSLVQEAFN